MPVPIPSQHNAFHTLFSRVKHFIIDTRLGTDRACHCHDEAHSSSCLLSQNHSNDTSSMVLNVLQKNTDILLERWMLSINNPTCDRTTTSSLITIADSIPAIFSSFACEMPLYNLLDDLYVIASCSDHKSQHQCYTYRPNQSLLEFMPDSYLKSKRFQFDSISIEVVYDEHIQKYKKSVISLVRSSMPWHIARSDNHHHHHHHHHNNINNNNNNNNNISNHNISNNHLHHNLSHSHFNNHVYNDPIFPLRRRLSRLSISALDMEEEEDGEEQEEKGDRNHVDHSNKSTISLSPLLPPTAPNTSIGPPHSLRLNYIHPISTIPRAIASNNNSLLYRRNSLDHLQPHRLVGSFEESLLSGRMSSMPSKSIPFHCQIGVLGLGDDCKSSLRCPPHWSTTFPAMYYELHQEEEDMSTPPPYVGTVDLQCQPGYRIPPKGQLQVVIKNPNKIAVKLFLIPYDFRDMPPNTKTFLRQKSYTCEIPHVLKYAIHLQVFKSKKRIYLYKSIRVVFANRKADAHEKFNVVCEGPNAPTFVPL